MKTTLSTQYFERAKKCIPGGVHSPVRAFKSVGGQPLFIEKAQGSKLWDADGNEFVDFCMSWGPMLLGHQDPDVADAVQQALHRGWTYGTAERHSLELAEFVVQNVSPVEKIRFVNSGTEAVMAALRLARAATGRDKILKFEGCYHGHVDSMLVRAGSGLAEMASPDSAGVSKTTAAETIVVPLNDPEALNQAFAQHGSEIAAVILEPLPANNGLLVQEKSFLQLIQTEAKKAGSLLIFDEVISGFRVGFGGMAEALGMQPDLVTYGKVIGGGFPVGAYGGRSDLMDMIAPSGPVYQAGTLSANPVAMAAGLATLKKLFETSPYKKMEDSVDELGSWIEKTAENNGKTVRVQRYASIFWMIEGAINPVRTPNEIPSQHKEQYSSFFQKMLDSGIYLAPSPYEVSFFSAAHTAEDLEQFKKAFEKTCR